MKSRNVRKINFDRASVWNAVDTVSPIPAYSFEFGPLKSQKIPGGKTNMTRRIFLAAVAVFCFALSMLAPTAAFAQAVYGSISGTVTDPTGAAVAGAKVTVTNANKGTNDTTVTNGDGNYTVTHLVPDTYILKVENSGFKSFEIKDVVVQADANARVDGKFEVGGTSEVVEVTAEAPQLKTDRADVAITFNEKAVNELPILNRNFTSFELLSPGTQRLAGWSHAATENPQGGQQIFVNGQHFSGTAFELDGTDNQDPILGIIIVNPTLESVTEAKITLQNYDAEFGKAVAGIVATQTKSGSNALHGSGFWFHRDNAGRATDPFAGNKSLAKNIWNQYGGSVGGAVIKDKLFFFGDYQGTRRIAGTSVTASVPTLNVRNTCLNTASTTCDLSEYGQAIYDPTHAHALLNNAAITKTLYEAATGSVAENILALLPAPNVAGNGTGNTQNNFFKTGSGIFNDWTFNTRWDYAASQKLTMFGRFSMANFNLSGAPAFGPKIGGPGFGFGGLAGQSLVKNRSLAAGFDYTFSSSLLMDFRFGWFQYNPHSTKFDGSTAAATALGLPGLNITADNSTGGLPGFFFRNNDSPGNDSNYQISNFGEDLNIGRCNCPLTERERQFQFVNNWTKIKGNHQIKFGVDLRHATNLRTPSDANRTGELNFNRNYTSNGVSTGTSGGLDIASFLFGGVTNFNRYVGSTVELTATETQNRYFLYGQDTWRITPKLTVNYGLRYEFYTPEHVNGKNAGGFAVLPEGVIRVAGNGGISSNGNTKDATKAFAPRIGLSYQADSKTVIRMGYGRSFDIGVFGSLFGHTVTQNLPVLANQNLNSNDSGVTPAFALTTGPAANVFPVVPSDGILPLRGPGNDVTPHVRPDKVRLPTIDAWNVTVQRQLDRSTSLEVAYVANKGTHVFQGNGPTYNVNQPSIVGFGTVPQAQRRPFYNKFTYANYPGLFCCDGDLGYAGNDSNNFYRALQLKVDRRLSSGLQVLAHYTYSKAYNYDSGYPSNPNFVFGRDDFNRDSVFVATALYELPFGKGKKFMNSAGKGADMLLGGWQWNSTWTIGSGLPWTPSYALCGQDEDTGPCRPSSKGSFRTGPGKFDPVSKTVQYFTPLAAVASPGGVLCKGGASDLFCPALYTNGISAGAFARPAAGSFGNVQRNSFTGPGEFLSDMSIFKSFNFTERVKAQLRFEFFNVFNHPVYATPNTCVDCIDTGKGTPGNDGRITGLEFGTSMRQMQVGLRVSF